MVCNGTRKDRKGCRRRIGLDLNGYCDVHRWQGLPRCQGLILGTRQRCEQPAKPGYDYCCATHNPTLVYIAPSILDPINFDLRPTVQAAVVAQYKGCDIYNRKSLDLKTSRALDLDHVVEKQCFTFAFNEMDLHPGDERLELATDVLRESVVNEIDNLALTRPTTNRIKGEAVWNYLDDRRTGHWDNHTLTSYLLAETRKGERLERDVTRRITNYMGRTLKKCKRKLADEGETPVLEQLSEELQQLYVAMELRGSR